MAQSRCAPASWPAAIASLDGALQRLRDHLDCAEAELRTARSLYEALRQAQGWSVGPETCAHPAGLSTQEMRIAGLVTAGLSNQEVAANLHLSVHTVKTHVKNILEKLAIRSRWQMAGALGSITVLSSPSEIEAFQRQIHSARDGAPRDRYACSEASA